MKKVQYKFITIEQKNNELFEGKPVYRIFNTKSGQQLGIISYYKPWKKYVFSTKDGVVFDNLCLNDILDFMEKEIK